jgi:DNA sulfur modification protein DndD
MILHTLTMKNFRQFKGVERIEFAAEKKKKDQNVTVIFGENGRGKTGIFRAIMFCLYGEHRLTQDEEVSQKELYLVNTPALLESASSGQKIEAYVELKFSHKGEQYIVKRSLAGMLLRDERIEQLDGYILSHTKRDGNTHNVNDPEEIKAIINAILDKNVREYFLFDGEKIQRLTLASLEQRKEIAKGIRNLLNVDALEKAMKAIQKLKKTLNQEIEKRATGEYGRIISKLNELDENRNELQHNIKQLEEEYSLSEIEKKKTDKRLEEYNEIKHLLNDRAEAEEKLKYNEEQARSLLLEMKSKTGKASLILMSKVVDKVFTLIDQKKQKGEIPSEIRKDLIDKILSEKKCICNREVLPGSKEFKAIIDWKNKTCDFALENSALEVWRYLGIIRSHRDDTAGTIEVLLQKYAVCKNDIDKLFSKIDSLNDQIGTSGRKDAEELEKYRENIEKKQIKNEAERMKLKDALDIAQAEYELLLEQRRKLEKEEHIKSELSQRVYLVEETLKALQSIYDQFTDEIKQKIADEATKFFVQLLDKEGRETLSHILVNEDYSLQITDRWGKPFLANISAGQRQIMSISFIAALAKVASGDGILEMPLFMDTPFGRLSFEHRKNILEKIPQYCAQWILLATDTEFRKQEASLLRDGGRWGRFYLLKSDGPGVTKIAERNIVDAHVLLSDGSEETL